MTRSPSGARAVPRIFSEVRARDGGADRRKDIGSLVDVLVDTVARMQQDLASLRAENRPLRTPAVPQVVRAPRQTAFTTTKVPRFDGTTSWEQYRQVFDAIVRSNGWDGSTCGREVVTAPAGGNTESSASGRESSKVGGFVNDVTVVSFRTTATEAATEAASSTATCPTGLERSDAFLMWEVGSCCDSVPKLGRGVSVYAAVMACREYSGGGGGGGYYDPNCPGGGDHSWSPPEFQWCWSKGPLLRTLQDGGVQVKITRCRRWRT